MTIFSPKLIFKTRVMVSYLNVKIGFISVFSQQFVKLLMLKLKEIMYFMQKLYIFKISKA